MKKAILGGLVALTAALLGGSAPAHGQFSYTTNADGMTLTITGYSGPGGAVAIPEAISNLDRHRYRRRCLL